LKELKQLTVLVLVGNQISDVSALKELKQLKKLYLQNNPDLTKTQIAELQKALPKCDIQHNATK
jgi:Leucine-rich repeat (LRR) protein